MRHRSSVAVVESDQGELHLVLSPARSIDTHVVRCAPRIRRTPFLDLPRSPAQSPILRFRATRVSQTDVSPSIPSSPLVSRAGCAALPARWNTAASPGCTSSPARTPPSRTSTRAACESTPSAGARSWDAPPSAMSLSSSSRAKFEPRWSSPTVTRYSPSSTRDGSAPTSATPQPCSPARSAPRCSPSPRSQSKTSTFTAKRTTSREPSRTRERSPSRTLTRSGYGTTHSPRPSARSASRARARRCCRASLSREDSPTRAASSGASPSLDEDRPRTRARGISRADSTRTPRPETRWRWSSSCGAKEARTWT